MKMLFSIAMLDTKLYFEGLPAFALDCTFACLYQVLPYVS